MTERGDAAIDMVINNAGVSGGSHQSQRDLDFADALKTYDVDALGPLRISLALLPHLRRGTVKKLVHVTSADAAIAAVGDVEAVAVAIERSAANAGRSKRARTNRCTHSNSRSTA